MELMFEQNGQLETKILQSLPVEYEPDLRRTIRCLMNVLVFPTMEKQEKYTKDMFERIRSNPVVLVTWHSFAVGFLSFRAANSYVYVDSLIVQEGFEGNGIMDLMWLRLRDTYVNCSIVCNRKDIPCYKHRGNEFCVPPPH